jgi:hypothetical protein
MISMEGFKVADLDKLISECRSPSAIIELVPLEPGEAQPVYQHLDFGKLD